MDRQEIARKKIVKYIFLIYWMLIFEGAFRKWFFPEYHEIIFFLRDPVVLLVYIITLRNGIIKRDKLLSAGIVIAILFIPLFFLQVLTTKINYLTLIYGWRMYFYYLPLAFVIKDAFHHEDLYKLIRQTLYISIPLSVLAFVQFISPQTSFINKGYSNYEVFTVIPGVVRTTGTFTFTAGQTMYAASLTAMLVFAWLYHKRHAIIPLPWLIITTGSTLTTLLVSGSRSAFVTAGLIIVATFVGLLFTKETKLKFTGTFLLIFLILVGTLMSLGPLKKSLDAITGRFKMAEASEGSFVMRAIAPLFIVTSHIETAPLIGNGLGLTSGGGSKLATGKAQLLLAEDDWSRIIEESGPAFGLLFIFYRFTFTIVLMRRCLKAAKQDNNLLPMIFFGFIGHALFQGQIASMGVIQGYTWIFVGLMMAAAQKQQNEEIQSLPLPFFPNIIGSSLHSIASDVTNSNHVNMG
jgi:hypothetical protein